LNEKREIIMQFRVTPKESGMIETKMKQLGTANMSAYLRKMAVDGYVVRLDLPELKDVTSSQDKREHKSNSTESERNTPNLRYRYG